MREGRSKVLPLNRTVILLQVIIAGVIEIKGGGVGEEGTSMS